MISLLRGYSVCIQRMPEDFQWFESNVNPIYVYTCVGVVTSTEINFRSVSSLI
jgi:hypothetical protein